MKEEQDECRDRPVRIQPLPVEVPLGEPFRYDVLGTDRSAKRLGRTFMAIEGPAVVCFGRPMGTEKTTLVPMFATILSTADTTCETTRAGARGGLMGSRASGGRRFHFTNRARPGIVRPLIRSVNDRNTSRFLRVIVRRRSRPRRLTLLASPESLSDLATLPGNRLAWLRGERDGQCSIRIDAQ